MSAHIGELTASYLTLATKTVNEWAEEKGWNAPQNEEQKLASRNIAQIMLTLCSFGDLIEDARKGKRLTTTGLKFKRELSLDELTSLETRLSEETYQAISELALIFTELVECVDYLLHPSQDDHCSELSGEDAELADIQIRLLHYCGKRRKNLGNFLQVKHAYNTMRGLDTEAS